MEYKRIIASGRVQGVGYRAALQRKAQELKLLGYVQNLQNGTVEAIVTGEATALAALIKWCWEGPTFAAVKNIEVTTWEKQASFSAFLIRR